MAKCHEGSVYRADELPEDCFCFGARVRVAQDVGDWADDVVLDEVDVCEDVVAECGLGGADACPVGVRADSRCGREFLGGDDVPPDWAEVAVPCVRTMFAHKCLPLFDGVLGVFFFHLEPFSVFGAFEIVGVAGTAAFLRMSGTVPGSAAVSQLRLDQVLKTSTVVHCISDVDELGTEAALVLNLLEAFDRLDFAG